MLLLLRGSLLVVLCNSVLLVFIRDILEILAQCNRPKLSPACTSSLGFSYLYILMLWFIVTQVIVLHRSEEHTSELQSQ